MAHLKVTSLCCLTFQKSEVSFTPCQKPEIMQRARVWETSLVSWVSLIFSIWPFKFQLSYCQQAHFSVWAFRSWVVMLCHWVICSHHFRGLWSLHLQGCSNPGQWDCLALQDKGTMILSNVRNHSPSDRASHPRRLQFSTTPL